MKLCSRSLADKSFLPLSDSYREKVNVTKMDLISLILFASFIVLTVTIISKLYQHFALRRQLKDIPQVGRFPFGVAFELIKLSDYERVLWYAERMKQYKDGIFIQWIGTNLFINLYKPEYLEMIMPSTVNIEKGDPYFMLESWLGKGLITSTGKQWNHDRRLIGPTFHFSILDQFALVMFEKAEILIKCLEKELAKNPGKAINIFPYADNVALDIICETAMGVNVRTQETETKYTSTIHRGSKLLFERFVRPWYWSDWVYGLVSQGKEHKSVINTLHSFTREVIRKRKIVRESQKNSVTPDEDNENDIGKRKRKAFLDLLLDQNEKDDTPLTDDEVRAQVDTFMFAGHDTTAVAITWTLFLLGNNLEHQEKVHEELDKVFQGSEKPASLKELSQLKYLERVIKESLRIFPSAPMISRKLAEDVNIGDHVLPKGVTVLLDIALTHRNPEVWPDPEKFDPDRFLPENAKNRNPYAYIPFSAGPRNCIGQRFALLEEKIILAAVLRKWKLKSVKTADEIEVGLTVIFRPCEEVLLHFTPKK